MEKKGIIFLAVLIFSFSFTVLTFGQNPQQGEVNINAEVPQWPVPQQPGGIFIPPSQPIIVSEPIPEHPEIPKSLIINENAAYTSSLNVTLSLSAENAFQMAISNSPDFTNISWEPYLTSKSWVLAKEEGSKTVYAKFRSPDGGVSVVVSDTIVFDTTPPTNISDFEAIAGDSQIELKWQNPSEPDFKAVKIMRSEKFYPSDLSDGILVYDGKGTSFLDKGLKNGVRYYYTAFAYDEVGNYASGAVASAVPQGILPPEAIPPEIPPPPEEIPPAVPPPPEVEKITLENFDFIQEGEKIPLEEGIKIKTETKKPLTISIDYEKVPEVLKTIMVTIEKDKKIFSFLLRIDKEKTAYLATIVPPEEARVYPLTFTILDYKNQILKKISGQLEVKKTEARPLPVPWYQRIIDSILNWLQSIWQTIKNFFRKIF